MWDPHNVLIFSEAFEALLIGRKISDPVTRILRERFEDLLGRPEDDPKWFDRFYEKRSRIVHGDEPIVRPGALHENHPDVRSKLDTAVDLEWRAAAALLAMLQDLVKKNDHSYRY